MSFLMQRQFSLWGILSKNKNENKNTNLNLIEPLNLIKKKKTMGNEKKTKEKIMLKDHSNIISNFSRGN